MRSRTWLAAVVGVLVALLAPSAAQAFTTTIAQAAPADPTAGAHSDFTLTVAFDGPRPNDPDTQPKDLVIDLPAGLIGNPNNTTRCTVADFNANHCDPATIVGSVVVGAKGLGFIDVPASGDVYNLVPVGNEPARLGIKLNPIIPIGPGFPIPIPIHQESPITVRTTGDYGLTSTVSNLPRIYLVAPLDIKTMSLTLFGHLSNGKPFMTNPTSCGPAVTRITATAYSGSTVTAENSFTPTNCDSVPFDPTMTVTPDNANRDAPAGYDVSIKLPEGVDRGQAHIKNANVALPEGTALSSAVGSSGLEGCTDEQFGMGTNAPISCPALSQLGTVSFTSPPVGTLQGRVYLGMPTPNQLLRIFIIAEANGDPDALRVKLEANVNPDKTTGQVFTSLTNLPPVPITDFTLTFRGGDNAVLSNPLLCGTYTGSATLDPDSGNPAKQPSGSFAINAPDCPNPAPFHPAVSGEVTSTTAGGDTAFTLTVSRDQGTDRINQLTTVMPGGLLGRIADVPPCDPKLAAAAQCPQDSLLGKVAVQVGPGGKPQGLTGLVYLERRLTALNVDKGGPVGALSIVIPGKVGPLDLGTVVATSELRLINGVVNVEAPSLPTILQGIPLNMRVLALTLDRPHFLFNATGCDVRQLQATFGSIGRQTATATAPYQATDCGRLPFTPTMAARAGGKGNVTKGSHPGLKTAIIQDAGEAGIKTVQVKLPPGIGPDPKGLARACPEDKLAQNKCPKSSIIGTGQATTALLPLPISGVVRFVSPKGGGLPQVDVDLKGVVNLDVRGSVGLGADGSVTTTFDNLPDVPLQRFELSFLPDGVLTATKDLCPGPLPLSGTLTSQAGVQQSVSVDTKVDGCGASSSGSSGPKVRMGLSGIASGRPTLTLTADGHGKRMSSVSVALPKGLTVRRTGASVQRSPRSAKVRLSRTRVRLTIPGKGAKKVSVKLRKGTLAASAALRKAAGKKVRFGVTVSYPKRKTGKGKKAKTHRPKPKHLRVSVPARR